MAKTLRVHNLAKELGVPSKVIVEKCQAEGVPDITNHMSTVKLGLAVTVRQWFDDAGAQDDGGVSTAVETAEKVDVQKAKAKARPARRKAATKKADGENEADDVSDANEASDAAAESQPAEVVAESDATEQAAAGNAEQAQAPAEPEQPAETPAAAEAADAVAEQPVEAAGNDVAEPAQAPATEAPQAPLAPAAPVAPAQPAGNQAGPAQPAGGRPERGNRPQQPGQAGDDAQRKVSAAGVVNVPTRPDVVKPAGQQMTEPKKVTLRGPKVVRVEKPEPVSAPRPRRGGPGGQGGPGGMAPGQVEGITRSRGPARGRGAGGGMIESMDPGDMRGGGGGGGRGGPRGGGRGGSGGGGGGGGRGRSARRSGRDQLLSGPTKLSGADIAEMENRLKGASGFVRQRRKNMNRATHGQNVQLTPAQTGGPVEIEEPITIKSLSAVTGIKSAEVIKYLFKQGTMATVNSPITTELATEVCMEYEIELIVKQQESALEVLEKEFAGREVVDEQPRPAIVTVLGHVDHGKTSLLDRVRKADVATHEDGGITQHIGAYRVSVEGTDGKTKTVVFVDTPGHEAFTAMRGRGARMTDLVVLVVAADDGVMPTTIEAINHAKAADVPIVIALNKIDLQGVDTEDNLQRIYGQLAEHGLTPQAWGGEVEMIKTSAHTGQGITELLEHLDLQSEILELTADYGGPGRGTVIEAEMQTGRGSVARVMVQDGQLEIGSFFVAGRSYGRVRDITDDRGNKIKGAGPATPLELSGIDGLPDAGDKFYICETLQKAEQIAKDYREHEREQTLATQKVTLQNFSATIKAGQAQTLNVVLKADVQGSVETLRPSLESIGNDEVNVRVLHGAVGAITESDVELASASDGVIIGFHVTATPAVREIAEQRGVEIRLYRVIYEITDDIKDALEGMLAPEEKETIVGQAKVQEVFKIGKLGSVAGCLVVEGSMKKKATKCRIERDGVVVTANREMESLRRVKDDVNEVQTGTECGIRLAGFEDIKPHDIITCYTIEEVKRTLD